jgi:hypothetical protein
MKKQLFLLSIAAFFVSAYAIVRIGSAQAIPHTDISYANDIRPILEARCSTCHAGKFVSEGLNVETYESLMTGSQHGPVIIPGDAGGSLLVEKLTSGQMPKRGPRLTPAQIQLIIDWINSGALNN